MLQRLYRPAVGLLAVSFAAPLFAPAWAETAGDPAALAPNSALAYIGVTDMKQIWADLEKTAAYKLYQQPEIREAIAEWNVAAKMFDGMKAKFAAALDTPVEQLKNPFAGPGAVYIIMESGDEEPTPVFIATVGDKELMTQYFETATKKMKAAASESETKEVGDATLHIFKNTRSADSANANGAEEGNAEDVDSPEAAVDKMMSSMGDLISSENLPPEIVLVRSKDHFIIAGNERGAKSAIDRESARLSAHDDYRELAKLREDLGQVRMFVNVPGIFDATKPKDSAEAEEHKKAGESMGIRSFRSFVGTAQIAGEEADMRVDGIQLLTSDRQGLARLLSFENAPVAPASNIDSNNLFFISANIELPKLLDEIERMLRQTDPNAADQMRAGLEQVPLGEKPVNMRKDFIDYLKGPITFGLDLRKPYLAEEVRMLVALGCKDTAAVTRFFSGVPMFTPREASGSTIFETPMAPISMTASGGRFILGSKPGVDTALAGASGDSLADSAGFRRAAKQMPSEAWLTLYTDARRMTEAMLGYVADENALNNTMNPGAMFVAAMAEGMVGPDEKSREAAKKLMPSQSQQLFTITTTPEGLRVSAVLTKPE